MTQTARKAPVPMEKAAAMGKGRVWYDLGPYAWYVLDPYAWDDLDPFDRQLWVVEGPAGYRPEELNPQELPQGFRWVDTEDWEARDSEVEILTARTDHVFE